MASFTERLLAELAEQPDQLAALLERLKREKRVCIWGTGVAGQLVCKCVRACGVPVTCFADGSKTDRAPRTLLGLPVLCPDEIPADAFILIEADVRYQIHLRVQAMPCMGYAYIDPLLLSHRCPDERGRVMAAYAENAALIDRVFEAFRDDRSQHTFRNVLMHRAVHSLPLLWEVFSPQQYFGNDVVPQTAGCFADCGAFTGDTLRAFLSQTGSREYCYYAFEPEEQNCRALEEYVRSEQLRDVHVCKAGVWDKKETLCFAENAAADDLAWTLSQAENSAESCISADTLDSLMGGRHLDFIKMDIEGAELRALAGAEQTIRRDRPTLAISSYHELDHLWRVPLAILDYSAGYTLYCRHHSWNLADTVCYGLQKDAAL